MYDWFYFLEAMTKVLDEQQDQAMMMVHLNKNNINPFSMRVCSLT
jgi:hypothetical protein